MSLVRFSLKKSTVRLNYVVNLQQMLQHYCYVEWTLSTKFCFDGVLKRSLSAHWMQVKLFVSLLIWIADCMQFLSENRLNAC